MKLYLNIKAHGITGSNLSGFRFLAYSFCILLALLFSAPAYALRSSIPLSPDPRIRIVPYTENEVFKFVGHYSYQSSIEFDKEEEVLTISIGDSTSWQITPNANRIFIKPIEKDATTNMTVITNRRLYNFELHGEEAKNINDPGLIFIYRFTYSGQKNLIDTGGAGDVPDLTDLSKYNLNYTIAGSNEIAPVRIMDDGVFTYFEFKPHRSIPAFYIVKRDQSEEMVNYRKAGDYIIVERTAQRFTLRLGIEITCVYNEKSLAENPLPPPPKKKSIFGF